jgi:hypothetical protein
MNDSIAVSLFVGQAILPKHRQRADLCELAPVGCTNRTEYATPHFLESRTIVRLSNPKRPTLGGYRPAGRNCDVRYVE